MKTLQKATVTTIILLLTAFAHAANSDNATKARQLFNTAYNAVFGSQGSTLTYSVNIIGIYKASGTINMKGSKKRFFEQRYSAWCNGQTYYKVDNKKKTVEIYDAQSPQKDKYSGKFAFSPDNFNYSYTTSGNDYIITLEAKPKTGGNIKHAQIYLDKTTKAPKNIRLKLLFFWTTIKITNFSRGGINDNIFNFPHEKFKSYKTHDKR